MSAKTSIPLFEIGESVPRPTTTPSDLISGTGATPPLCSFHRLGVGVLRTDAPARDADGARGQGIRLLFRDERVRVLRRAALLRREGLIERHPRQKPSHPGLAHRPRDLVFPIEKVV